MRELRELSPVERDRQALVQEIRARSLSPLYCIDYRLNLCSRSCSASCSTVPMNEDQFWCSALGRWIRLCISSPNPVILEPKWRCPQDIGRPLRYDEICDGYLLNALLELIYPECTFYEFIKYKDRSHSKSYRLSLLQSFLFNLVQFFKRHEKIPLTLPDIINVSQNSSPERSGHDLQQLIALLIGAVVHTTHKSSAVDQLRRLVNQEETSLGLHLQKVFDGRDPIIDLSLHPEVFGTIAEERHINTFKLLTRMLEDTESDETSSNSGEILKLNDRIPSPDEQKYHEVIEDLRLKNKHLTEKSSFLENQCHEQEDEIMRYKKDLDHLKKEKEKIQKDHDKLKETCRFVPALENKVQKLEIMERDHEKLKAEILKLKQNKNLCNEQAQEIIGLRKEVRELRGRNTALLNQKYDFTEKASIAKEKGKLAEDLQRTKEQKDEMEKENEDLRLQIEGLENKIEQMKCRMDDTFVSAPNISLCDELNESQREDQFKELQMENNSLVEIIKKNSEEISRYETVSKELREKIQEMEKQLNEKANDMHVKEKTVLVELNNYKNNIKSLDQKICDQLKVIQEKDSLINRLKQTEVRLQSELKLVEEIQKEKMQLEIVIQNKCNEIDHTRAETEDLRDELERLKKLHSQCDRSKKALQEELNLVRSQLETTDEDNRNLRLSVANTKIIQNRLQKVENELVKRDTENDELKANLRTLTEKYQLENKKLQQLRADLTKENGRLSSLVSKLRAVCMNCSIKEDNINDDELIERIDNVLIKAYTNAWKEAEALSQQRRVQLEEIKVFSKDIENLKKKGADLENSEKERDFVTVTKELNSMTERWRMAQSRETDLIEQIKSVKSDKEDLLRKNIDLKKDLSAATNKFNAADEENRRLTDQLKAAENQLSKLHLDLKEVKSNREALQTEFDRLNELYNSVAADFERSNYEKNDLKRRLGKKDQLLEDKMKTEFFNERCLLEDRLKQTNRELNLGKEQLKLCEEDLKKLTEELTENKKDYATLVRQKNKSDEMLNGLRIADVDQKNKIASLNESVNQLNEVINDKNTEISAMKKQLEYLKNLRQWNSEENDLLMKKIKSLMEQNQEMHYHSEVYVLSQQSLDERLNAVARYKRAAEDKMKECNNNSEFNKDKKTFMNKAAKALRLKSSRRSTKPIDKNSGSNTEDSSIYSADESCLPPLPEPRLEKSYRESVQVTPTCSSSERASGSSPDYDQVQYFSVPSKKTETSYHQMRSPPPLPPSSFSRLRNSRISSSVRYPPAHKIQSPLGSIPVTKDDESLSLSTINGYSTQINGSPIKSNGRPPPPYRGRPVGTPPVNRSYFNPLDTSTPKSAERSFSRVVGEGENRLTVRSPEERESKAQSFYDNHDVSQDVNKKTNDLWVGYGCV